MSDILFNINFDHWPAVLLSFIPALLNLALIVYSLFFLRQSQLTLPLLLFVSTLFVWQMSDTLMRMSATEETASAWWQLLSFSAIFITPAALYFTFLFVNRKKWKGSIPLHIVLFLPSLVLAVLNVSGIGIPPIYHHDFWGWTYNSTDTIGQITAFWIGGLAFVTLVLLISFAYRIRENNRTKYIQALLMAGGFMLPTIQGTVTQIIFPIFFDKEPIPLASSFMSVFSLCMFIALVKYRIIDYSPRHQWNNIVNTMNEGVWIINNEGKIMYANKKLCEMVSYESQEIKGKTVQKLFFDDVEQKKQLENITLAIDKKISGQYEIQLKTKSGKKIWTVISTSSYQDKNRNTIGSIGILTDVTDKKDNEVEIMKSITRLKQAQEIAHVGSWELIFSTGQAVWSDEACSIYGIPFEEKKQQSFHTWISFIHPEDLDFVKKEIEKSQASLSISSFEHRIVRKDGTVKHIHSVSTFEFDKSEKPIGLFGICYDKTENKRAEEKIIQSERQIRNFARHLNQVLEDERFRIAREIHDELGQRLVGIKIGLSSFNKLNGPDKRIEERITGMMHDVDYTLQSLRKIATELRPGILDTLGLIPSIHWLVGEFERKTGIKCHIEPNIENHKFDKNISTCFFRICQEALTNISKHAQACNVIISIQQEDDTLILRIADNGKGIATEKVENPFSMGLSGMQERANIIGAHLQITSKIGVGTSILLKANLAPTLKSEDNMRHSEKRKNT